MANKTLYSLTTKTNTDIINAARNASTELASLIPEATNDNIRDVAAKILSNNEYTNQFISALINRIGKIIFNNRSWKNPLKKFKEGMLEYGEITEEIFVNKIKEQFYSMYDAENTVFSIAIPDIRAIYYEMNSQKRYEATINESMLKHAFMSRDGLVNLVDGIITRMAQQDEVYEFNVMKQLMTDYATLGRFYSVQVTAATNEATAKALIKQIRAYNRKLTYVKNLYNYIGVDTHTPQEDIHLFISADLEALVDVEVLAKAFNMEKTEFLGHLTVLDELPITGAQAILVDKTWFRVYDNKVETTSAINPKGLYRNQYMHHWETFQVNPFANAILFTTEEASVTSLNFVNDSGTATTSFNIEVGAVKQLHTKIVLTGSAKSTVMFEITQGAEYVAEFTSDGESCTIRIKPNIATGVTIKVKATSQQDTTKTDTATLTTV